jgi:hypothetical protein
MRLADFGQLSITHERMSEEGIDPAKENAILGIWDAREADRCGTS